MSPDLINGLFEAAGAVMLALNCRRLYRDKQLKGVFWGTTVFFTSWSCWNLYFYPAVDQWWSFWGAVAVVVTNSTWLGMLIYYSFRRVPKPKPVGDAYCPLKCNCQLVCGDGYVANVWADQ